MRPFAELTIELVRMAVPGLRAVINDRWQTWEELIVEYPTPETKHDLLYVWDNITLELNSWRARPADRFHQRITSLAGQYEGPKGKKPAFLIILYLIDNEIHHRRQGYVYLRSFHVEPPPFWERPWVKAK